MARKKKDDVVEQEQDNIFVTVKHGYHSITLKHRTIFCPNGVACVNAEEKAELENMGLIA